MVGFNSWNTFVYVLCWLPCVLRHSVCPTLWDPVDCSPPGSSVHGIFQVRILKWVVISYSRGSSWLRDQTHISYISCLGSQILYHCATWEDPPSTNSKNSHTYAHHITKKKHEILVLPIDAGNFTLHSQRGKIPSARGPSSPSTMDGTAASLPSWFRPQGPHDGLAEPYATHGGPSIHSSTYHKAIILKWSSFWR